MTTATVAAGSYRSQRLTLPSGERTWTVLGTDHRMVEPAEEYLEYLRAQQASPNTVKSYARALALWWQYLDAFDRRRDAVTLEEFGAFIGSRIAAAAGTSRCWNTSPGARPAGRR